MRAARSTRVVWALGLVAGCVEHTASPITGTQSLEVVVVSPTDPGTIDQRLPDTLRTVTLDVTAKDATNQVDPTFDAAVRVYAQFLGTLTPELDRPPLATIQVTAGVAIGKTITLPPGVFGATTLWLDDGTGAGTSYVHGRVAGASPTLWFRDPFIADLQTPRDETALDALAATPLEDKQVAVRASRYGARGRLVVTSVFAQGYTVSDVACADAAGTPPCVAAAYDHALVFSFSAPRGSDGHVLAEGEAIIGFAGGFSEFNGLSEVGFPRTFTSEQRDLDQAREPAPVVLDVAWFKPLSDPTGRINFERNEAGPIEIRNGKVCPLDADYATYKQWKLAPGGDCAGDVINVITAGVVATLDPATLVGTTLPRVVGILRPVSIGSFNVWIIYPRGASDLTLQ